MLKPIKKLYDTVKEDRNGRKVVNAIFEWDGVDRCVPVLAGVHKVGDIIEVHLREYYSKEKKTGFKWWECVED